MGIKFARYDIECRLELTYDNTNSDDRERVAVKVPSKRVSGGGMDTGDQTGEFLPEAAG